MVYRRLKTDSASRFSLAPRQLLANAAIAAAAAVSMACVATSSYALSSSDSFRHRAIHSF
jgi:hypothetical protein